MTAPQPLDLSGPMAQSSDDNRNARRRLDTCSSPEDELEVQSYYGSRVNNTTLRLRIGSITIGKSPTYQPKANPSEFIAKQVAYPPDSYSRRELTRTLWPDTRMMVSLRGHSMDPAVSVQNINFSGNGKELTKVLGADEETKSHLH